MLNSRQNKRSKLATQNELLLLLGRLTSKVGNIIYDYANQILLVNLFQSKSYILAIYQGLEIVFSSVFNLLGGVMSDLSNKKKIVILTDILSAAICFFTGNLIYDRNVAVIVILANAILAIINSFNSPCYKSIVRELVTKERVRTFNSISNAGYEIISIIGPLIGLLLVDNVGVQWALYFDSFTFLISAMIESFFRPFYAKTVTNKKFKKEFMKGAYVVGKTKNKKIEIWLLILGIGLSIVFIPLFKLIPIVLFKLIPFSLCGIVATMYNVSYISTLQEMVALDFQGRIFGIIQALVTIFMPIGALTFSLLPIKCESFYAIGTLMVVVSVISSILMKKTNIKIYQ